MKNKETILDFLNFLSFQVACEIEINNINFESAQRLIYKEPINLN